MDNGSGRRFSSSLLGKFGNQQSNCFSYGSTPWSGVHHNASALVIDDLKAGVWVVVLSEFLPKQFSVDALYTHREHLPAKVRTLVGVVARNLREIDWDACLLDGKRSGNQIS